MIVFKICRVVLKYDTMVLKGFNVLLGTGYFRVSHMVITHTSAGDKKRGTIKVDIRTGLVQADYGAPSNYTRSGSSGVVVKAACLESQI